MFCKYCGKPIDEGTMRCRICGRPVGPLEGGNGFWDLLEGKKEEPEKTEEVPVRTDPALAEEMKSLREEVEKLRRERKMHPAGKSAAPAVMAALLGLLAMALGVFVLYQMRAADASGRASEISPGSPCSPASSFSKAPTRATMTTGARASVWATRNTLRRRPSSPPASWGSPGPTAITGSGWRRTRTPKRSSLPR